MLGQGIFLAPIKGGSLPYCQHQPSRPRLRRRHRSGLHSTSRRTAGRREQGGFSPEELSRLVNETQCSPIWQWATPPHTCRGAFDLPYGRGSNFRPPLQNLYLSI